MRIDEVVRMASTPGVNRRDEAGTVVRRAAVEAEEGASPLFPDGRENAGADRIDQEALDRIVEMINKRLSRVNHRLELYIVDESHEVAARIVDTETDKVVKEIPPAEVIELRSRLDEMAGLLFDRGA